MDTALIPLFVLLGIVLSAQVALSVLVGVIWQRTRARRLPLHAIEPPFVTPRPERISTKPANGKAWEENTGLHMLKEASSELRRLMEGKEEDEPSATS